ncbi:unnamed protein product [Trifolium pratense]|uniref:Uncharacterized protein n=1 Tax=Trifolium pratense TaxID=57577 RepID=A0ACB0JS95_TRIPR|nr:unnamed protein product [Trifolium pratense]
MAAILGNQTDHFALLKFKEPISDDPNGVLDSWNSSIHFCKWGGITCNPMHQRVIGLNLEGYQLHGSLSPHIGNLTLLKNLNLGNNSFYGEIPKELGNNLIGKIPIAIASLKMLQRMTLSSNKLTGGIPSFIGNLSCLTRFSFADNNLEGDIPQAICLLKKLTVLRVGVNNLSGTPPSCLYNITSLTIFFMAINNFHGPLPPNMFHTLPNIQMFGIAKNQFSGPIPTSINASSSINFLDIPDNNFVGQVPSLGKLKDLYHLNLERNNLGHLVGLISLYLESNHLEGVIPTTFGKFQKLQLLSLRNNQLSGDIPHFVGNLSQLFILDLYDNTFEGNIPPSIGNCQKLQYLKLSQNKFRGTIPLEVFNLFSLTNLLDLSHNSLSGSLPKEVGMLKNIDWLDVSENHLSGNIPETIGECVSLEYLNLQGNSFNGTIPSSLASHKGLRYLDLSRNQFYGPIPDAMQNISSLEYLDVSYNMLEGEVPIYGVFGNATQVEIIGNNKLCGGIAQLHLPPCHINGIKHPKHHEFRNQKRSFDSPTIDQLTKVSYQALHRGTDGFSTRNLIGSGSFGSVYRGNLVSEDNFVAVKVLNLQKQGAHKSFIVECNALKNIRHRNLVKILTCCSSTDYTGQEFKALVFDYMKNGSLEQWLHPEILNAEPPTTLDLSHRLNIIIDVASALHYLHHECEQLVIHCDLKPSNVLLDNDMVAHVSDFGISRLILTIGGTSHKDTSTIGIKGTVGYAPPEYGMGFEVSTCGDMYTFGILVLEMLTGRRPTDETLEDGQNLHNFVRISFPDNLINILDPHILSRDAGVSIRDGNSENLFPRVEECLISLFKIGLVCSMESPKERMNIVDVNRELIIIKKAFLAGEIN